MENETPPPPPPDDGVLTDAEYLKFLFDLLSEVAARVERAG